MKMCLQVNLLIILNMEIGNFGKVTDPFKSILDHEALHIYDNLHPDKKVQDLSKKWYRSARGHQAEEMVAYVTNEMEWRAFIVQTIKDLNSVLNKTPGQPLEDYLENSAGWGRLKYMKDMYDFIKSGGKPQEPESGYAYRVGGRQEELSQLKYKYPDSYKEIIKQIFRVVPKTYKAVYAWYDEAMEDYIEKSKEKTTSSIKSFADLDRGDFLKKKYNRVAEIIHETLKLYK